MFQFQAIAQLFMRLFAIIFIAFLMASCNANKRWIDKGKRKGWLDTITTVKYDTIRLNGSTKDTSFLFRSDTIFLKDKHFTTYYFRDTITQKETIKTIVYPRDTIIKTETKTTTIQEVKSELPWWVYVVGGVLLFIIFVLVVKG